MNGDNQILPLAWGIMSFKSIDNWTFFLSHFRRTFPSLGDIKITAISDRSKGLEPTLVIELSHAIHAYCCHHLCENLMKFHPGDQVRKLFWKATKARSETQFKEYLEMIWKLHTIAAEYLEQIPSKHWVKYAILGSWCGHLTSNIVESVNFLMVEYPKSANPCSPAEYGIV